MNVIGSGRAFSGGWPVPWRGRLGGLALLLLLPTLASAADEPGPKQKGQSADAGKWEMLFDGKTLDNWKVADEYDFDRHGKVRVADRTIVLAMGAPATGIRWTGKFPNVDYEVTLEAMRVEGDDFFCGMTFPVGESALTLVLGGWGGSTTGVSSIDGEPAAENETCGFMRFQQNRWYRVRLRVRQSRVEAWVDEEKIVDVPTENRKFTIYWEMEPMQPFGICTWVTTGALRDLRMRRIQAAVDPDGTSCVSFASLALYRE